MECVVQFSGGKDSTAALIYTLKEITSKPKVVFCDTGWESPITYEYIDYIEKKTGIEITRIRSKKYPKGMIEMSKGKKRFPSAKALFCTIKLKIEPMIDYILGDLNTDFLAVQGIRRNESHARSKMNKQCTYFKYYFEPGANGKKHSYRGKEVREFCKTKVADIIRPVFEWTGNEVMNYILDNGFEINELYKKGFKRVGCFPCINSNLTDIKNMDRFYPERIQELQSIEKELNTSFFAPGKIPKHLCKNKRYPTINEVANYVREETPLLFDELNEQENSCFSFYNICE